MANFETEYKKAMEYLRGVKPADTCSIKFKEDYEEDRK